jgi:putative endonuclease
MHYVYMMASESGTLYIGSTHNLARRVEEHKTEAVDGFTKKYKCKKFIYYEEYEDELTAYERERQLKNWNRRKKEHLIMGLNPEWKDLSGLL